MDTTSADTVKAAMLGGYEGMLSRRSDEAEVSNRRPMLLYEGGPGHPLRLCMGHWVSGKRGYEVCWNWVAWNLRHRYVDGCDGSSGNSVDTNSPAWPLVTNLVRVVFPHDDAKARTVLHQARSSRVPAVGYR